MADGRPRRGGGAPGVPTYRLVNALEAQGLLLAGERWALPPRRCRRVAGPPRVRRLRSSPRPARPARAGGGHDSRDRAPVGTRTAPDGECRASTGWRRHSSCGCRSKSGWWCRCTPARPPRRGLAFLAPEIQDQVLSHPLTKVASGTITDPGELRAELAAVRARGWAVSREETNDGAWGVAAPGGLSRRRIIRGDRHGSAPLTGSLRTDPTNARDAVLDASRRGAAESLGAGVDERCRGTSHSHHHGRSQIALMPQIGQGLAVSRSRAPGHASPGGRRPRPRQI